MSNFVLHRRPFLFRLSLFVAFLSAGGALFAAPLRVTTWNLDSGGAGPGGSTARAPENRIEIAARDLRKLNPDVILLHNVRDWGMCARLADALLPAQYNVLVCSSFHQGSNTHAQVAILSKQKAFISWFESWRPREQALSDGGYVFAAIQAGEQRIGFYALQIGETPDVENTLAGISHSHAARAACVKQWMQSIDRCKHWVTNRVESIVASGALRAGLLDRELLESLEAAGFSNPFLEASRLAGSSGPVLAYLDANANNPPGLILDHWPATCDLDFDFANSAAAGATRASVPGHLLPRQLVPALSPDSSAAIPTVLAQTHPLVPAAARQSGWWIAGAGVGILALAAFSVIFLKRKNSPSRVSPSGLSVTMGNSRAASAYTIVVTPSSGTNRALDEFPSLEKSASESPADKSLSRQDQLLSWKERALRAEHEAHKKGALVRQGLVAHANRWLREKLVRRLIADRAHLIETQHDASLDTLALERRLARVEAHIQQQNHAYERRIEDLTRELQDAKFENRELILSQILQVKAEMKAAREKLIDQAKNAPTTEKR